MHPRMVIRGFVWERHGLFWGVGRCRLVTGAMGTRFSIETLTMATLRVAARLDHC